MNGELLTTIHFGNSLVCRDKLKPTIYKTKDVCLVKENKVLQEPLKIEIDNKENKALKIIIKDRLYYWDLENKAITSDEFFQHFYAYKINSKNEIFEKKTIENAKKFVKDNNLEEDLLKLTLLNKHYKDKKIGYLSKVFYEYTEKIIALLVEMRQQNTTNEVSIDDITKRICSHFNMCSESDTKHCHLKEHIHLIAQNINKKYKNSVFKNDVCILVTGIIHFLYYNLLNKFNINSQESKNILFKLINNIFKECNNDNVNLLSIIDMIFGYVTNIYQDKDKEGVTHIAVLNKTYMHIMRTLISHMDSTFRTIIENNNTTDNIFYFLDDEFYEFIKKLNYK